LARANRATSMVMVMATPARRNERRMKKISG
jgi:hypothetical protein